MNATLAPLAAYDVDPATGFLPATDPVDRLPPGFSAWDDLARDLGPLIRTRALRGAITDLPLLDPAGLTGTAERERAFLLLTVFANGWVWGGAEPDLFLPAVLARPLDRLARLHDRPPIVHYASMALRNWRRIDAGRPIETDNLTVQVYFLGGVDEDWFTVASLGVELAGAPLLASAHRAATAEGKDLRDLLESIAAGMTAVLAALERMRCWCDPHVFYNRVRPYLAGWPAPGVVYDGVSATPRVLAGGSAGQSSLIQSLDALLGIVHHSPFLQQMRAYMPVPHRRFVTDLAAVSQVRARAAAGSPALRAAYDAAVDQVEMFRRRHMALAHDYITRPSGQNAAIGTGGTSLTDFLRATRMATAEARLA